MAATHKWLVIDLSGADEEWEDSLQGVEDCVAAWLEQGASIGSIRIYKVTGEYRVEQPPWQLKEVFPCDDSSPDS